jgi:hypothetical protein
LHFFRWGRSRAFGPLSDIDNQLCLLKLGTQGGIVAFELRDPHRLGATLVDFGSTLARRQAGHDSLIMLLAPIAQVRGMQAFTTYQRVDLTGALQRSVCSRIWRLNLALKLRREAATVTSGSGFGFGFGFGTVAPDADEENERSSTRD